MRDSHAVTRREQVFASGLIVLVLIGAAVCVQPECFPTSDQQLVRRTLVALESRRPESLELAREYLKRPGAGSFGLALAAESAAICFEHQSAIDYYRQLPSDGGRWEYMREMGLARRFEILGQLTVEERHLKRALELDRYDTDANYRLGNLLQVEGRSWEAISCFFTVICRGKCRGDELLGLAAPDRFFRADERLERDCLVAEPPEPIIKLAIARRAQYENRHAEAESLLKEIIAAAPSLGEAQGRLGRIIFDRGDPAEFSQWRSQLPYEAMNHPETWFVQGLQARRLGQFEGATRCFLETLSRSPNHVAASVQVAGCLELLNRPELARQFAQRGEALANLESLLNMLRNEVDSKLIENAISTFEETGRYWEAAGWALVRTHLSHQPRSTVDHELRRLQSIAVQEYRPNAQRLNPVLKVRLEDFKEPQWPTPSFLEAGGKSPTPLPSVSWQFVDQAHEAGIQFRYFEGTTEANRLQHIFNVVGGGLAAADFDRDGWCDLYLAQANDWRNSEIQPEHFDRLFRNHQGSSFSDITKLAGLGDLSFSHGIAAGDFDQDGFLDIYVGNLGPNRLYRNNGDGTFDDVTAIASVAGNEWTTSSVFADFNGDGLPDLYVANYSLLDETAKRICRRSSGEEMACTPDLLTAEFHRFYVNQGDGRFRDVTTEAGLHQPNGRGLGLVVWDFEGNGRLGLFVANDTSANFFFVNQQVTSNGIPHFQEEGVLRGVAFDVDGGAQASMGVAAGDINGDGRIDMYITNFFGESDTLYSQRSDLMFDDSTRPYQLRDAGFWTLGFGCQFADFDGDGWEDIIATNGHVDQHSYRGDPDRTPPQLFQNRNGRKFDEIPAEQLGPFFIQGHLGRGLAKVDWNRDGRPDFAVSHLHEDFALVTNKTPYAGSPLVVRLSGRSGARDPIGAFVTLRVGKQEIYRLLTGGDGYLVSNDRSVQFSIPSSAGAVELEVRWPGGGVQKWSEISAGQELLLIEGRQSPVKLHSYVAPEEQANGAAPLLRQ